MTNEIKLRDFTIGNDENLSLMGGMNVLESRDLAMNVAEEFVKAFTNSSATFIAKSLDSNTFIPPINDRFSSFPIVKSLSFISFVMLYCTLYITIKYRVAISWI